MAAGSITVDLLMRTASFETDTKRAEKQLKDFQKTAVDAGKAIGLAFTAAATATAVFFKKTVDGIDFWRSRREQSEAPDREQRLQLSSRVDRSTEQQLAAAAGRSIQRALARGTA